MQHKKQLKEKSNWHKTLASFLSGVLFLMLWVVLFLMLANWYFSSSDVRFVELAYRENVALITNVLLVTSLVSLCLGMLIGSRLYREK